MRIFRATNPVAISFMEEYMLPSVNLSSETRLNQLKYMLKEHPANTFVLQAFEGEELVCFVVAYAPFEQTNILLAQAWCSNEVEGREIQDSMFLKLCLWGQSVERDTITAETDRNVEALYRRWGFEETTKIVEFKLDGDFEESLMKTHKDFVKNKKEDKKAEDKIVDSLSHKLSKKGNDNGRQESGDNSSIDTVPKSGSSVKTSVRVDTSKLGKATGAISGSAGSGSNKPVPSSPTKP